MKNLLLIMLIFFSYQFVSAQDLLTGVKLIEEKKYKEADIQLAELLRQDKNNSLAWFNLGVSKYKQKNYLAAVKSFSNVISLKSKFSEAAKYYKALSFLAMDKTLEAQESASSVSSSSSLYVRAQSLISAVSKGGDESFFKAEEAYKSGDFNNCLNEIQDSLFYENTIGRNLSEKCQGGLDMETEEQILSQDEGIEKDIKNFSAYTDLNFGRSNNIYQENSNPTAKSQYSISLGGEYMFGNEKIFGLGLNYDFSDIIATDGSKDELINIYIPIEYSLEESNIRAEIFANTGKTDSSRSYNEVGGNLTYYFYYQDMLTFEITGSFSRKNSVSTDYDYLTGNYSYFQFKTGYEGDFLELEADIKANNVVTEDIPLTPVGFLPYAYRSLKFGLSVGLNFTEKFSTDISLDRETKNYINRRSVNNIFRKDILTDTDITLKYRISENTKIYLESSTTNNESNYDDSEAENKNYRENVSTMGVTWYI